MLEGIYTGFKKAESRQLFDLKQPIAAVQQLVDFVWDYYGYGCHPKFISILNSENLHKGKHPLKSPQLQAVSGSALNTLEPIIQAGQANELFRADMDVVHTHLVNSSLCCFYNSNLHTLGALLGADLDCARSVSL
ncbi:hypothetical protein [Pseudomonas extremaustralis]|uniref:hypothetical protein n=1 Tax=Pseudomonas extremaustralis TaxID=359110 RepID=UPI00351D42E9